jgi:hypothetical protein
MKAIVRRQDLAMRKPGQCRLCGLWRESDEQEESYNSLESESQHED